MQHFISHVYVGIGDHGHYFTLRRTYETVVGLRKVRSEHIQNLSQDPDEAIAMAAEYARKHGLVLKSTRADLPDDLKAIFKDKRERVAAARAAKDRKKAELAAAREAAYKARRSEQESKIRAGEIPFGKNEGKSVNEVPGFARWMVNRESEFEDGSILKFFCEVMKSNFPHLLVQEHEYTDTHIKGAPGTRVAVDGRVDKVMHFHSDYGISHWVFIKDDATGALVVCKGKWTTEEGKLVSIIGNIREKGEYKGTKQTILNRVKELARAS